MAGGEEGKVRAGTAGGSRSAGGARGKDGTPYPPGGIPPGRRLHAFTLGAIRGYTEIPVVGFSAVFLDLPLSFSFPP